MARSDFTTPKKDIFYSDFTTNMLAHPASGLLVRRTNEDSIQQALKNLILTNLGERLYQPSVGGNVSASLFEPMDGFTKNDLSDAIKQTIFNNEPRVASVRIEVQDNISLNQYDVTISFTTHHKPDVTTFDLVLKRLR